MEKTENKEQMNLPVIVQDAMTSDQISKIDSVDAKSFGIDSIIASFNVIPVIGGVIANELSNIKALLHRYKEDDFFRKFLYLIYNIKDTSDKDRKSFMSEVEKEAEDYSGSVIAGMVDRIDNVNKAAILANLMKARMGGKIDIEDFFRLSNVVERIPYTDFKYLKDFEEDQYLKGGITEMLYSTGVLSQTLVSGDDNDDNLYVLSDIGIKLCKYGLLIQVNERNEHGTSIPFASNEEIQQMIDEVIPNRNKFDDDEAQFEYDRFRGK